MVIMICFSEHAQSHRSNNGVIVHHKHNYYKQRTLYFYIYISYKCIHIYTNLQILVSVKKDTHIHTSSLSNKIGSYQPNEIGFIINNICFILAFFCNNVCNKHFTPYHISGSLLCNSPFYIASKTGLFSWSSSSLWIHQKSVRWRVREVFLMKMDEPLVSRKLYSRHSGTIRRMRKSN